MMLRGCSLGKTCRGVALKIYLRAKTSLGGGQTPKKKTQKPSEFQDFCHFSQIFRGQRRQGASFYAPEEIRAEVNGITVSSEMSFIILEIDVLSLTFSSKSQLDYVFFKKSAFIEFICRR